MVNLIRCYPNIRLSFQVYELVVRTSCGKRIQVTNDRENEHPVTSLDDLKLTGCFPECLETFIAVNDLVLLGRSFYDSIPTHIVNRRKIAEILCVWILFPLSPRLNNSFLSFSRERRATVYLGTGAMSIRSFRELVRFFDWGHHHESSRK